MVQTVDARARVEAEPEEVGLSSTKLGNFTGLVQGWVDERVIPGAITMLARRGKVAHFQMYGNMDDEARRPMEVDAIFRMASMTKPIASLGLMLLYEENRFDLWDPVSKYIPEFKGLKVYAGGPAGDYQVREPEREMTVRDVLTHTSGLMAATEADSPLNEIYREGAVRGDRNSDTLAGMVAKLAKLPLGFDPGSRWHYGISTDIVGYLCEVLNGLPFDRYLEERILGPLGMEDTGFWVPPPKAGRLAASCRIGRAAEARYVLSDPASTASITRPVTYFSGTGGLVSTAADYMRFARMLGNGGELDGVRIAGRRTIEFMTLNHFTEGRDFWQMGRRNPPNLEGIGFGLGLAVLMDPAKAQIIGTPGEYYWSGAHSTHFFVSPNKDLVMLFMTQLQGGTAMLHRPLRIATYQAIID